MIIIDEQLFLFSSYISNMDSRIKYDVRTWWGQTCEIPDSVREDSRRATRKCFAQTVSTRETTAIEWAPKDTFLRSNMRVSEVRLLSV